MVFKAIIVLRGALYNYHLPWSLLISKALHLADLELLSDRQQQACTNFAASCHVSGTLSSLFRIPMVYYYSYNLHSGSQIIVPCLYWQMQKIQWFCDCQISKRVSWPNPCNSVVTVIGLNKRLIDCYHSLYLAMFQLWHQSGRLE